MRVMLRIWTRQQASALFLRTPTSVLTPSCPTVRRDLTSSSAIGILEAKAAATPGAAAAAGHAKKYNAWHAHCIAQGDVIVPLAMETGGRICEGGASLLDDAANATGGTKGEKLAFLTYWRQRIAISNLKGVARAIAKRIPICTGDHFPISFQRFTTGDHFPIVSTWDQSELCVACV